MNILSAIRVLVYLKLHKLKADYPAVCVMYQLSSCCFFFLYLCFLALLSHNNILFLSTSFDCLLDIVSQSRCTGLFWIIPFNPTDCQNFNPHLLSQKISYKSSGEVFKYMYLYWVNGSYDASPQFSVLSCFMKLRHFKKKILWCPLLGLKGLREILDISLMPFLNFSVIIKLAYELVLGFLKMCDTWDDSTA